VGTAWVRYGWNTCTRARTANTHAQPRSRTVWRPRAGRSPTNRETTVSITRGMVLRATSIRLRAPCRWKSHCSSLTDRNRCCRYRYANNRRPSCYHCSMARRHSLFRRYHTAAASSMLGRLTLQSSAHTDTNTRINSRTNTTNTYERARTQHVKRSTNTHAGYQGAVRSAD